MTEHFTDNRADTQERPLFELRNASLAYRALPALRNIDFRIARGEQWACVGPNGAGKTSLARILSNEATHFSGEYRKSDLLRQNGVAYVCFEHAKALCDRDKKLDDSEFRGDLSDPGTTVERAILGNQAADDDFDLWVERLGIAHILQRGLRYISTGEMRKTLLIRAIFSRPALLILDSPLDGLDKASQESMRELIEQLLQTDLSVLMLCRQLQDIPRGISHIIALDGGEIVAQGGRELLQSSTLENLMNPPLPELALLPQPAERPYMLPDKGPLLALKSVSVSYGELRVLNRVDWEFDRGAHCCVSGPNGCGKTTLLSLVTGDNHKAYGQDITLFGIARGSGESVWEIKQKYGQIDTQLHLNFARGMKVIEVVVSGFFDTIGLFDEWGDAQRHRASEWLQALGLASIERESFDGLSFGMQRMVLLARAMVKSPIILLLDEPTLGLDAYHRRLILRAIDHIADNSDTQIIFVSHSAGEMPRCINQHLQFVPGAAGFDVVVESA